MVCVCVCARACICVSVHACMCLSDPAELKNALLLKAVSEAMIYRGER